MSALAKESPLVTPEPPRPNAREKQVVVEVRWRGTIIELAGVPVGGRFARMGSELVRVERNATRLFVPARALARVTRGARELSTRDLLLAGEAREVQVPREGVALPLGLDDVAHVELGGLEFVVRHLKPEPAPRRTWLERLDVQFASTLVIALLVAFTVTRMIALHDFSTPPVDDVVLVHPNVFTPRAPPPAPPKLVRLPTAVHGGGVAHQGDHGAPHAAHGHPHALPGDLQAILDAMGHDAHALGDHGGIDRALSKLGRPVATIDGNGLDTHGIGPGGGGPPGSFGIGDNPFGPVGGPSHGTFGLGEPKHPTVVPKPREAEIENIDPELIRRVVQKHWNELRYCYEKELSKDPNLGGKVALLWTIGPDGMVVESHVGESTLGSPNAERCMAEVVKRWQFPAPKGSGIALVNYPFIFEAN